MTKMSWNINVNRSLHQCLHWPPVTISFHVLINGNDNSPEVKNKMLMQLLSVVFVKDRGSE